MRLTTVSKAHQRLSHGPPPPFTGRYEVQLAFPPASHRATEVPVVISGHSTGSTVVLVDQSLQVPIATAPYLSLGEFTFLGNASVEVRATGVAGSLAVDALRLITRCGATTTAMPATETPPVGTTQGPLPCPGRGGGRYSLAVHWCLTPLWLPNRLTGGGLRVARGLLSCLWRRGQRHGRCPGVCGRVFGEGRLSLRHPWAPGRQYATQLLSGCRGPGLR